MHHYNLTGQSQLTIPLHKNLYRCLITALYDANRVDLIDELECVLSIPMHRPLIQLPKHDLDWYGSYLKKQYMEVLFTLQLSANKWLPSLTQKIFNLAIIKKEKIQRGKVDDEFVHKTIRGQIDDILLDKSPIELKDIFKNIEGERKVILIDGAPGSGKSTLTVHICQQWGRGELFNEFTVVILVQLRDPRVQSAHSITNLLPCENRSIAEQIAAEIMAVKGSGVLWILDGFDELPSHLQKDSIISTLIRPNLYQENPLSKTAVMVTSRPISSGDLCPIVSSRIEVLGFTAEEQRLFFTKCLNNDRKAVEALMERLSSNPAMEGSCYLPLNASIVAHLYIANGSLPSTIYGIFSSLVQHCLSRYLHERQGASLTLASFESFDELPDELHSSFKQLCKLAFTGARNNKVTFSSSDIEALGSSVEICKLGLLQAAPSIVSHGSSVYHNFLHLSVQEMLAAVHISRMSASEQISTFDSMFNESDAQFSAVLQFYAAITKLRASRPLLSLVPRFLRPVPASIYDLVRKIIQKGSQALLVSLLNCLYEAQDTDLCKYVGEQLRDNVVFLDNLGGSLFDLTLYSMPLLPQDCLSIGYFLACIAISYNGRFSVNLNSCSLGDTGIKILMQSLSRSLDPHSEITGHLDMDIRNNEVTEVGASYIAEALRNIRALNKLNLRRNPIGDKGLKYIAEALTTNSTLTELSLYSCRLRITEESGPALTEMLQQNKSLRELDLSLDEAISNSAALFIIKGLKKNTTLKTLYLRIFGITDEDIHLIQSSTSTCNINYHESCVLLGPITFVTNHTSLHSREIQCHEYVERARISVSQPADILD